MNAKNSGNNSGDCCGGVCRTDEANAPERTGAQLRERPVFEPDVDVFETPTEFVVQAEMPGVTADALEVEFEENRLHLRGRVAAPAAGTGRAIAQEYRVGDYARTFVLTDTIDPEKITAEVADGLLTVKLGKRDEIRPRRIAVKQG